MEEMPIFVKVEMLGGIRDMTRILKANIREAKETLSTIGSLSAEETVKISEWKTRFDIINERINNIRENLVEPEKI